MPRTGIGCHCYSNEAINSHCIAFREVLGGTGTQVLLQGQPLRFASETGDAIYDHKCEYFDNRKVIFYLFVLLGDRSAEMLHLVPKDPVSADMTEGTRIMHVGGTDEDWQ